MCKMDGLGHFGSAALAAVALLGSSLTPLPAQADEADVVIRADWGAGPGQLGRRDSDESAPEGPMSFAVAPDGDVWFLDQVNRRLVRFDGDGTFREELDVGSEAWQGLALGPDGELILMDRLAERVVRVFDADGTLLGEVPLEGFGIAEGGGTTALFAGTDGVWVEYEHSRTWRVLDGQWRDPFYRLDVPGRPLGTGEVAGQAWRDGKTAVGLRTLDRFSGGTLAEATLGFDEPVRRIVELAGDAQGNVVLAVHLATEDPARDYEVVHEEILILVLDPALAERRRIATMPSLGPWEQTKELEVSADGTIWQMAFDADGVEVRRWLP